MIVTTLCLTTATHDSNCGPDGFIWTSKTRFTVLLLDEPAACSGQLQIGFDCAGLTVRQPVNKNATL